MAERVRIGCSGWQYDDWRELFYPLVVNLLGIFVVALLAGYLAERLRITGGALEQAQRRAVEAERLAVLGRLTAGLAHEIRNPLGSISGSIERIRVSRLRPTRTTSSASAPPERPVPAPRGTNGTP